MHKANYKDMKTKTRSLNKCFKRKKTNQKWKDLKTEKRANKLTSMQHLEVVKVLLNKLTHPLKDEGQETWHPNSLVIDQTKLSQTQLDVYQQASEPNHNSWQIAVRLFNVLIVGTSLLQIHFMLTLLKIHIALNSFKMKGKTKKSLYHLTELKVSKARKERAQEGSPEIRYRSLILL